jgi:hypothetical protein
MFRAMSYVIYAYPTHNSSGGALLWVNYDVPHPAQPKTLKTQKNWPTEE